MIASIPSPSSGVIELGPLELHAYGLMIALGVVAAVTIASRRLEARGGDGNLIGSLAVWAVPYPGSLLFMIAIGAGVVLAIWRWTRTRYGASDGGE